MPAADANAEPDAEPDINDRFSLSARVRRLYMQKGSGKGEGEGAEVKEVGEGEGAVGVLSGWMLFLEAATGSSSIISFKYSCSIFIAHIFIDVCRRLIIVSNVSAKPTSSQSSLLRMEREK